ncbi:DMT family transporter [Paenibacillus sp. D9]|uniref:DMT family transporter n=1 Tax=Paenibacillus sp. D9 TaxID=665792 RepID=UPI000A50EFE2|nr:DMT family transporter [Paenibacillus sp. D9]
MGIQIGKMYLFFAFALAGTSVVTARLLSASLGMFTISSVSLAILLLGLAPIYASRAVRTIRSMHRQDWKAVWLQAVFGIFGFRTFLLLGLTMTSAGEAGILTGAAPALTACLAYFVLREPLTAKAGLGVGCTAAGIALLQGMSLGGNGFPLDHLAGNLLILCAVSCEAIFNVLSRNSRSNEGSSGAMADAHPMVQTLLVGAAALALCAVPAMLEHPVPSLGNIGPREWLALAWYGLAITALSYGCFYAGIKRCDVYTTAAYAGWMPLTSLLLSMLLLGEKPPVVQWLGGALVIGGMLLIGSRTAQAADIKNSTVGQTEKTTSL